MQQDTCHPQSVSDRQIILFEETERGFWHRAWQNGDTSACIDATLDRIVFHQSTPNAFLSKRLNNGIKATLPENHFSSAIENEVTRFSKFERGLQKIGLPFRLVFPERVNQQGHQ